ncbi:MAG: MFS transporter [Actinomycetaceae bacterium]|nr:MFS transporter [Actinomycetaceae bacterium]
MATLLTRSERLDRLPFTQRHSKLLLAAGIGWALDAMDVGLVSFIVAALAQEWGLRPSEKSMVLSVGFIGMAIGAALGGKLADMYGRRKVFVGTLVIYGLATGLSALAPNLGVLIVLRFLTGLGLGAELPVASTLMTEFAPRRIRGRVIVWLEAFWALGWILAASIGTFVVAASPDGWRWGLVIGAVPAVYAIFARLNMPESVRYLEKIGRYDAAEKMVRHFEEPAGAEYRYDGPTIDTPEQAAAHKEAVIQVRPHVSIWSRAMRRRTTGLWALWFFINLSYYGAFMWIPSLLVERGFDITKSFTFTLIITLAQIPGYAAAAWLIERLGRRNTLALFLAGSALAAVSYGMAGSEVAIIAAGCALSFFNLGAWGALYAVGPELYPTQVRGSGTGAAAAFGRLAAIIAPMLTPILVATGGMTLAFGFFAAAFALAAASAYLLPEQRGKAID